MYSRKMGQENFTLWKAAIRCSDQTIYTGMYLNEHILISDSHAPDTPIFLWTRPRKANTDVFTAAIFSFVTELL